MSFNRPRPKYPIRRARPSSSTWISAFGFATFCLVILFARQGRAQTSSEYGVVIGIDIGNTNSRVAYQNPQQSGYQDLSVRQCKVAESDYGNRYISSCVAFTEQGVLVGDGLLSPCMLAECDLSANSELLHLTEAKLQESDNPSRTICGILDLIGRPWNDSAVQDMATIVPYRIVAKDNLAAIQVTVNGKDHIYMAHEIAGHLVAKLKSMAEAELKTTITHAVMGAPAHFKEEELLALKQAGAAGGLEVLRIGRNPISASIAYDLDRLGAREERNVLIFDMGGSTTHVTVLSVEYGVFEIWATATTSIGGRNLTQRVFENFLDQHSPTGVILDEQANATLQMDAESAKKNLTSETTHHAEVLGLDTWLTREKFEHLNEDLFHKAMEPITHVLKEAKLNISDVDVVLAVGGSSKVPRIRQLLTEYLNKAPLTAKDVAEDEAVVLGLAIQGAVISDDSDSGCVFGPDVNPLTLGVGTVDRYMDNMIEHNEGYMHKIIPRNTPIPTRKRFNFTTYFDNQSAVVIQILEGERAKTKDNTLLAELELEGILPAPRRDPIIEVTFEMDANGILKVDATDLETHITTSITLSNSSTFRDIKTEEYEAILLDAEKYADEWRPVYKAELAWYMDETSRAIGQDQRTGWAVKKRQDAVWTVLDSLSQWLYNDAPRASFSDFEAKTNQLRKVAYEYWDTFEQRVLSFPSEKRILRPRHDEL